MERLTNPFRPRAAGSVATTSHPRAMPTPTILLPCVSRALDSRGTSRAVPSDRLPYCRVPNHANRDRRHPRRNCHPPRGGDHRHRRNVCVRASTCHPAPHSFLDAPKRSAFAWRCRYCHVILGGNSPPPSCPERLTRQQDRNTSRRCPT